jgi:hypothetical protein
LPGFGKNRQTDITPNTATDVAAEQVNASFIAKLATEDDAAKYGKSHEFAENVFKTGRQGQIEVQLRGVRRVGDVHGLGRRKTDAAGLHLHLHADWRRRIGALTFPSSSRCVRRRGNRSRDVSCAVEA